MLTQRVVDSISSHHGDGLQQPKLKYRVRLVEAKPEIPGNTLVWLARFEGFCEPMPAAQSSLQVNLKGESTNG